MEEESSGPLQNSDNLGKVLSVRNPAAVYKSFMDTSCQLRHCLVHTISFESGETAVNLYSFIYTADGIFPEGWVVFLRDTWGGGGDVD